MPVLFVTGSISCKLARMVPVQPEADTVTGEVFLDVVAPDEPSRSIRVRESPFLNGRNVGNQLQLNRFLDFAKCCGNRFRGPVVCTLAVDGSYQPVFRSQT